ncbi:MAG: SAP domain-containing protein [Phycisphaerae bacterium]|nr:SAP domain-containing protein [Phycisphaerae bacterium]
MPATQVLEQRMNMPEIKAKARALGITPGKMKKAELIHSIQLAERCTPCYGRSGGDCHYTDCCFRADCL